MLGAACGIGSERQLTGVSFTEDGIVVDAEIIGRRFGVEPGSVPELMRSGTMTSRTESGEGEDAGRHRLTFFYRDRALRLVVNDSGEILANTLIDLPPRPDGQDQP